VSYGSGPYLPTGEGFGVVTCPAVPYGPQASSIKKGIASLHMQLGSRISKACSCGSKAHDVVALARGSSSTPPYIGATKYCV
jgi:hypothetical protein